jgi:predicted nucleic acid-binding protein
VIIDSDVIIWGLNGNQNAKKAIADNIPINISVVNYMEVVQGMKNKKELIDSMKTLKDWKAKTIYLPKKITTLAAQLVEKYYLSNNMQLADALIAATVLEKKQTLLTGNMKHFDYIPNIKLLKFIP